MKYLLLLAMLLSCSKKSQQNSTTLLLEDKYFIEAKFIDSEELKGINLYYFENNKGVYKVISEEKCKYNIDEYYILELSVIKRPENQIPNLSIEYCIYRKGNKICSDVNYTHLYEQVLCGDKI